MNRPLCFGLPVWLSLVSLGFGQTAPPAAPAVLAAPAKVEMPTDPAALVALAAKSNGLQNAGGIRWHLKARYEALGEQGEVKETGTFEEWWATEKKYKLTYTTQAFSQTDYSTEVGLFRTGEPAWPKEQDEVVQGSFLPPFPSTKELSDSKLEIKEQIVAGVTLTCVTEKANGHGVPVHPLICVGKDEPILRVAVSTAGLDERLYNDMIQFQGTYLARDVRVMRFGRPFANVRLEKLEPLKMVDESIFKAPAEATEVPRRTQVGDYLAQQKPLRKVPPQYPEKAKAERVEGTVVIRAFIGADGHVGTVQPVSGPLILIEPSLECVRQWVYKPTKVDGKPVEIETFINVVYSLRL